MREIHSSKHYVALIRPDTGLVAREVTVRVCGTDVDTSWLQAMLSKVFYVDSDGPMRLDLEEEDDNLVFEVNGAKYSFPNNMVVGIDADGKGNCFSCGITNYLQSELESCGSQSFVVCTVGNRLESDVFDFASKFSHNIRIDTLLFLAESSFGLHTTSIVMAHIDPQVPTAMHCIHASSPILVTGVQEPKFQRLCDLEKYMEDRQGKFGTVVSINGVLSHWG